MPYKDPEAARERNRRYYAANRDKIKTRSRVWVEENPERRKEIARSAARRNYTGSTPADVERATRWQAANPDRVRTRDATRRARKRQAFVEAVDPTVLFDRDQGRCGICGEPVDPANYHVDHIVPLCRGGKHSYANTQVAHPACNIKKGKAIPPSLDFTPAASAGS
jgi:5-methylcytosine-specific restriction endonuclease McrA